MSNEIELTIKIPTKILKKYWEKYSCVNCGSLEDNRGGLCYKCSENSVSYPYGKTSDFEAERNPSESVNAYLEHLATIKQHICDKLDHCIKYNL